MSRSVLALGLVACTAGEVAAPRAPPPSGSPQRCAATATLLCPGDNVAEKARAAGAGATLTLQPGVYRLQTIAPLAGQTFQGQPGAVLSGARLLTEWTSDGAGQWYVSGQTQQGTADGVCDAAHPACRFPEDLFVDDLLLVRVTSLAAATAGRWYFDYAADRIYLGSDPTGHAVETSVLPYAFTGRAGGVTIQGLTIEKYATPIQHSAVFGSGASGWRVLGNEIRWNHGSGTNAGANWLVRGNNIHHNGQLGVHPNSGPAVVDSNEIAYNNTTGVDPNWGAGGLKAASTATVNLTMRGNFVHHNQGFGLWCDNCSATTRYLGNRVEDNTFSGIYHEVSADALIDGNTVLRNGSANRGGIWVDNSANVEITNNTVSQAPSGLILLRQLTRTDLPNRLLTNVFVHDNDVALSGDEYVGLVQFVRDDSYFTSKGNRFDRNRYTLPSPGATAFRWNNASLTRTQWQVAGQDPGGTFPP